MQSHLFLHHVLLYHLMNGQVKEAVLFASHYQHLVYFAHALEMTLHNVVEEDVATLQNRDCPEHKGSLLADTIAFLDHFDICLDVVVGCARVGTRFESWEARGHTSNIFLRQFCGRASAPTASS